jgi:hypothetical protein
MAWLTGWQYRRPITINNSSNSNSLTDYQISVTLNTQSLISAGKMRSDGGDIRFIDSNGTTLLNYWVESGINTSSTYIWVKVPSIPANSTKTIYVYYGNSSATSQSNGDNTFVFFDDFDTDTIGTKWNYTGSGSYSIANSIITLYNSNAAGRWYKTINQVLETTGNYAIRFRARHEGSWDIGAGMVNSSISNKFIHFLATNYGSYKAHWLVVNNSGVRYIQYEGSDSNWHIAEERNIGTTFYAILDGVQKDSYSVSDQTHGYVAFNHSGSGNQYLDWILARKFTSPEPTTSVGAEEIWVIETRRRLLLSTY